MGEHAPDGGCGLAADLFFSHLVGFGQAGDDVTDKGGLVALAALGDGSHVGGVSLKYDAVEGDCSGKGFGQVALLERQHAADAQDKLREVQQLASLLLVARKTMENATGQLMRVLLYNSHQLVLRFATVNHQRQACHYRPAHLLLKGL